MIRVLAGAGGVTVLALLACLEYARLVATYNRGSQDAHRIGLQLERWAEARRLVPEDAVVGWVSDLAHADPAGAAAFMATQYALAPRLLVDLKPGRAVGWVVGSFSQVSALQQAQAEHGLRLVRDFGEGRALFERGAR